jgi:hypothetical protein
MNWELLALDFKAYGVIALCVFALVAFVVYLWKEA